MTALLEADRLTRTFSLPQGFMRKPKTIRAVDGVSFSIARGETLALVGESGCGKSTVANLLMQLVAPSSGTIRIDGKAVDPHDAASLRDVWKRVQMVFQDPYASLNPRMRAEDLIAEPLVNFGVGDAASRRQRARELLGQVGLPATAAQRHAHEFSGGQRQRLGIARALALKPELIVADEPVSALDVSVQAQILNLLADIKREERMAYLFVSHDLGVVEYIADTVAVMYLGTIVERAPKKAFFAKPLHPYAQALVDAVPAMDPSRRRRPVLLQGDVPSAANLPSGCRFRNRCPLAHERCAVEEPALREAVPGRFVACHAVTEQSIQPHPGGTGEQLQETSHA
ncbi:ABC transporter ATP-binding protein [Variovorax sp. VNK109]|jgi:oligopeptide transport system ATP-binding protein|uniref:ABC transporter ATP-binding protein n=1 Tax=Variovorax sp. VNK109 TaxID=3400919 RepID=UPI003C0C65F6